MHCFCVAGKTAYKETSGVGSVVHLEAPCGKEYIKCTPRTAEAEIFLPISYFSIKRRK